MKKSKKRKNNPGQETADVDVEEHIEIMFLDSGAHSLYERARSVERGGLGEKRKYEWFETDEFWSYVDEYAEFVKEHQAAIDMFVNVDVVFNPELSWRALRYLEDEHGLNPVPVIHYGTDLKWVKKHLKHGYDLLGIGGLGQEVHTSAYFAWADRLYEYLCPAPKKLPVVRTHGFAMTSYPLLIRYPWWSVDSASWVKAGGFGKIFVPRKVKGKFDFSKKPYTMTVSDESPAKRKRGTHFDNLEKMERKIILQWLEHVEVPLGSVDDEGEMAEWGVVSHHSARKIANLKFFDALANWLPEWPWPFTATVRKGFGVV